MRIPQRILTTIPAMMKNPIPTMILRTIQKTVLMMILMIMPKTVPTITTEDTSYDDSVTYDEE